MFYREFTESYKSIITLERVKNRLQLLLLEQCNYFFQEICNFTNLRNSLTNGV